MVTRLNQIHHILSICFQVVEVMDEYGKQTRMMQVLNDIMNQPECKTIIFTETKRKADDLTKWMRRDGWPALCIHGDKNQGERDWVLNGEIFKTTAFMLMIIRCLLFRVQDW